MQIESKKTGSALTATEFNQIPNELENLITKSGQTASSSDLNQVAKAVTQMVGDANFYATSGTANAIVLFAISPRVAPIALTDGLQVRFKATATNTGAVTVNLAGLGAKKITNNGNELTAGLIKSGSKYTIVYNLGSGEFNVDVQSDNTNILSLVYPVGSIYMSLSATNPATLFGFGEWEQIKDTFLLASGDNHKLESTGGEETHTLTSAEMPSHTHTASTNSTGAHTHSRGSMDIVGYIEISKHGGTDTWWNWSGALYSSNNSLQNKGYGQLANSNGSWNSALDFKASKNWTGSTSSNGAHTHTVTVNATGSTNSHNNMPPYLAVNVWKRVA